jgi:hypothetical protein
MIRTFERKTRFLSLALCVLGEAMFVLGALSIDTTWRVVGLSALLVGIYFLWIRRRTDSVYGGTTLVLSWFCVVVGLAVVVVRVMVGDFIFGILLGLLGIAVGATGILKAKAGE